MRVQPIVVERASFVRAAIIVAGLLLFLPPPSSAQAEDPRLPDRRITIELRDAPLDQVLYFMAEQADLNLVLDDGVDGKITLRMRNVKWRHAFEMILRSHGLSYEIEKRTLLIASD